MKPLTIKAKITNRDLDSLKMYLKDIYAFETFTPDEEAKCAEKAANGDSEAFNQLVNRNLRFVVSVAKEYETKDCPLGDLINEGNIGLILAAKRFKPNMGFKFISYAVWWIRKHINEYQTNLGRTIRIPSNRVLSMNKLNQKINTLEQKMGRAVDMDEVIEAYKDTITDDELKSVNLVGRFGVDSLDRDVSSDSDGGVTLGEVLSDDSFYKSSDHLINNSDVINHVKDLISTLKPKEQEIITALFGLNGNEPQSLTEVGDHYNVTRECIRLSRDKILTKLRVITKNTRKSIEING
jgi:RNA polymerase primary sigma factor|tara:strand:- start:11244 stop:12128 length:885 start_codon:yes stop_codon:yes gene_type:complete